MLIRALWAIKRGSKYLSITLANLNQFLNNFCTAITALLVTVMLLRLTSNENFMLIFLGYMMKISAVV